MEYLVEFVLDNKSDLEGDYNTAKFETEADKTGKFLTYLMMSLKR